MPAAGSWTRWPSSDERRSSTTSCIPLIHAIAALLSLARCGEVVPWLFLNHPMGVNQAPPPGWGYNLLTVFLLTAAVVVILYFPCRWFAEVKSRRRAAWLSYL